MLRKFYWVPFYFHIALIFLGLYQKQEGAIFFQLRLSMLETLYTYLSINIQPWGNSELFLSVERVVVADFLTRFYVWNAPF